MNQQGKLGSTLLENIDYKGGSSSHIIQNALKDKEVSTDMPPQRQMPPPPLPPPQQTEHFETQSNSGYPPQQQPVMYPPQKQQPPPPPPPTPHNTPQPVYNLPLPPMQEPMDQHPELRKRSFISDFKDHILIKKIAILFLLSCIFLHTAVQEKIKTFAKNEMLLSVISSAGITASYFIVSKIFLKVF